MYIAVTHLLAGELTVVWTPIPRCINRFIVWGTVDTHQTYTGFLFFIESIWANAFIGASVSIRVILCGTKRAVDGLTAAVCIQALAFIALVLGAVVTVVALIVGLTGIAVWAIAQTGVRAAICVGVHRDHPHYTVDLIEARAGFTRGNKCPCLTFTPIGAAILIGIDWFAVHTTFGLLTTGTFLSYISWACVRAEAGIGASVLGGVLTDLSHFTGKERTVDT